MLPSFFLFFPSEFQSWLAAQLFVTSTGPILVGFVYSLGHCQFQQNVIFANKARKSGKEKERRRKLSLHTNFNCRNDISSWSCASEPKNPHPGSLMPWNQVLVYLLPLFPKWSHVTVQLFNYKSQKKVVQKNAGCMENIGEKTAWGPIGKLMFS